MERVTRAEAARQLGHDRATVTRWVQKHPALLDSEGLVSVEELRRHRDATINPKLQTRFPAAPRDAKGPDTAAEPGDEAPQTLNDHRSRTEAARAVEAELDLADRLGLTLKREDVENAVALAGETIRQRAGQLARDRAETLARIDDPRAMERALDDMLNELLTESAKALAGAARSPDRRDAA